MAFQFTKILTGNSQLDRIQANISSALSKIVGPFIGGNVLTSQLVTAANPVAINHGLGRTPVMWLITDQDTNTTVKRTAWDANTITLQADSAGSDCTISLYVN